MSATVEPSRGSSGGAVVAQIRLFAMLRGALHDLGWSRVRLASRARVFPHELGAIYLSSVARHPASARAIDETELKAWLDGIAAPAGRGCLFGTIGHFLVKASIDG